jgi:hypothetical protein
MICFFMLYVVCPCKLADGAGWEWDEWNVVKKFRGYECICEIVKL